MTPTFTPRSRTFGVALAIGAGVALAIACGMAASDLLCVAPALMFAALPLMRRYPGERRLLALRTRPARRSPCHTEFTRTPSPRPASRIPRGALLMAFALAVRPPPRALSAS